MAWTSDVKRVADRSLDFATYRRMWEKTTQRFGKSRLGTFLTGPQIDVAAEMALKGVVLERLYPNCFTANSGSVLLHLYAALALKSSYFPPGHNYITHESYDSLPEHVKQDYIDMVSMAGQEIYEWEKENGRFPTRGENQGFGIEGFAGVLHPM